MSGLSQRSALGRYDPDEWELSGVSAFCHGIDEHSVNQLRLPHKVLKLLLLFGRHFRQHFAHLDAHSLRIMLKG
jgi:hypothetical protein